MHPMEDLINGAFEKWDRYSLTDSANSLTSFMTDDNPPCLFFNQLSRHKEEASGIPCVRVCNNRPQVVNVLHFCPCFRCC